MLIGLWIFCLLLLGICVCNMFLYIRYYNEYKVFNENVRNWSSSLNDEMKEALHQAAMSILIDMDNRIEEEKNNLIKNDEENEESSSRRD